MGTFIGHIVPSIAYSLLALWWGLVTAIKHVRTRKSVQKNKQFLGSIYMPCFYCPNRALRQYPIETLIKLVGLGFHILIEILTGLNRGSPDDPSNDGHLRLGYENAHHVVMIGGFVLGAIVELLIYSGVPFPPKADYTTNLMAFLIQFLIMTTHLNGDVGLEQLVHKLWTILIFLTLLSACAEWCAPNNVWAVYMRICFFLAQGTWLAQVSFVVWPHTSNPLYQWSTDHASHTWLSISLMLHLMLSFVMLMTQYAFVCSSIGFFDRLYTKYESDRSVLGYYDKLVEMKSNEFNESSEIEYATLLNDEPESA